MLYFKVKIGTIWLTSDGTANGEQCKITAENWERLQFSKTGNAVISASAKPHFNLIDVSAKAGIEITFKVENMLEANYSAIRTLFENTLNTPAGLSSQLIGNHSSEQFTFTCMPKPDNPLSYDSFTDEMKHNVIIKIITT